MDNKIKTETTISLIDWPEAHLWAQLCFIQNWPLKALSWLLSVGVPNSSSLGKFGNKK